MPDGNRSAIDIDLGRIQSEFPDARYGLGGERFVQFDQINIVDLQAGPLQRFARRRNGPIPI